MAVKILRENVESEKLRDAHNRDLIRRMRNGEPLSSFDSQSSWFPPRPIIEKDEKALSKLYGADDVADQNTKASRGRVLQLAKD